MTTVTKSSSIIYKNHVEEISSLKGQISYAQEMIIEANACGEKWAAKEYAATIPKMKERLNTLTELVNNASLWS